MQLHPFLPLLLLALALVPLSMRQVAPIDTSLFDGAGHDVRSFTREIKIDAPASVVFEAWTDGETFREVYDGASSELRATIELAIGGAYEWLWDGKIGGNGCQVLSYIPDRMLSFSWNAPPSQPESRAKRTWVVVEFDSRGADRTHVRLTHLGFGSAPHWDETFDYFGAAWTHVLQTFKRGLEA